MMPNGVIQSYTIRYAPTGRPSEASAVVVRGNESDWEIQGLRAFTNYLVELSANTSVGSGPAHVISVRTEEDGRLEARSSRVMYMLMGTVQLKLAITERLGTRLE